MKIFKTVHIENIKFEPLDEQFFPIFIGWAKAFCGFSESRLNFLNFGHKEKCLSNLEMADKFGINDIMRFDGIRRFV